MPACSYWQCCAHAQDGELKGDLVSSLRARVEGMQRIALKVQNVLDEIASMLERGMGVVTWADPNASALFLFIAIAGALAIATLGLHTVLAFALCWLVRMCSATVLRLPWLMLCFSTRSPLYLPCLAHSRAATHGTTYPLVCMVCIHT